MNDDRYVFQRVTALTAVSVGEPGRRTFFIAAGEGRNWVRIWIEKEELQALATVLSEVLETVVESAKRPLLGDTERAPEVLSEPATPPAADFKLKLLTVGYDEDRDLVGLFAYGGESPGDPPALTCWVTRPQAKSLSERIEEVCAAGRPNCRLCGGPIDPSGHVCPKSNGHQQKAL